MIAGYKDADMHDLEVVFFKANCTLFNVAKIYQIVPYMLC